MTLRLLCRLILLAPLLAAACAPGRGQFAPVCPVPGLVKPLSELTRYRAGSRDLRDLEVRARIVDIAGTCKPGRTGTVAVSVKVVAEAVRGPGASSEAYRLPVFVAVTEGADIRDKTLFWLPVEFPRGRNTVRAASEEIEMELPVAQNVTAAAYGIVAGFQLTPEEVEAFRRDRR